MARKNYEEEDLSNEEVAYVNRIIYNRRNITEWNMLIKSKSCVLVIVDTELLMQRYRLLTTKI